jgi:hypothetical protein
MVQGNLHRARQWQREHVIRIVVDELRHARADDLGGAGRSSVDTSRGLLDRSGPRAAERRDPALIERGPQITGEAYALTFAPPSRARDRADLARPLAVGLNQARAALSRRPCWP